MDSELNSAALGLIAAVLIGISKTGVPGVAMPAVLLVAEAFAGNEKLSLGAILPLLLLADVFAVRFYRAHTQWRRLLRLVPYVLVGMVAGTVALRTVDNLQFRRLLGWLILGLLLLEMARRRWQWTALSRHRVFVGLIGGLAGFGTVVGNAAGPAMSIYMISQGMPKQQFMGTAAWFFLLVNLSKVPIYLSLGVFAPATVRFDAIAIPMVIVGALLGKWLFPHIPQRLFDSLVLAFTAIAALRLIGIDELFYS